MKYSIIFLSLVSCCFAGTTFTVDPLVDPTSLIYTTLDGGAAPLFETTISLISDTVSHYAHDGSYIPFAWDGDPSVIISTFDLSDEDADFVNSFYTSLNSGSLHSDLQTQYATGTMSGYSDWNVWIDDYFTSGSVSVVDVLPMVESMGLRVGLGLFTILGLIFSFYCIYRVVRIALFNIR